MLRRRDKRNHQGYDTASVACSGIPYTGRNSTGRMVRFAMDLPKGHDSPEFSAYMGQYSTLPLEKIQKPRKGSFSWKPVLRRNGAPARVPAASRKKRIRTSTNDHRVDMLLAANEIERILRDDVHSRDIDQVRLDEDDEDDVDDASYDEDGIDFDQSMKHHQVNDSGGREIGVSLPRTSTVRNSVTLASSLLERRLTSSSFWPKPQRISASTTSIPLPQQARQDESQHQGLDDGDDHESNSDDDKRELTEHDVNAYDLFDSAGADEARWRLNQRREHRRRDESEIISHHNANNNNNTDAIKSGPYDSFISWIVLPQGLSSSLYSHDSAVIYLGKPYDVSLVTSFLVVVWVVFVAMVVLQIISHLWLLSTTSLGGWIIMTVAVTGPLIQLWQFTGRLTKMLLPHVEPCIVWFRRRLRTIRRPDLSTATARSSSCSSSSSSIHPFCSICLESYSDNDDDCSSLFQRQYLMVCKHFFHHHCIQQWLEHHDSCPICRIPTSFESYKYIHSPHHRRRRSGGGTVAAFHQGNDLSVGS